MNIWWDIYEKHQKDLEDYAPEDDDDDEAENEDGSTEDNSDDATIVKQKKPKGGKKGGKKSKVIKKNIYRSLVFFSFFAFYQSIFNIVSFV